jgi:hypothetical protein
VYVIDKDVSFKDLNDQAIVVNIRTGFYYTLNGSATVVFHGIRERRSVSDIARVLTEKFDVTEDAALSDVLECLHTFLKENIAIERAG